MLLRPIFCEKLKTAPPETFEFPNLAEKSASISVKTFFFYFWRPPDIGRKKPLNFGFRSKNQTQFRRRPFFCFFFRRPPDFGRKKPLNFGFRPKNQTQFRRRPFFFFSLGDHLILGGKNLRISEKFRLNFRTNRVKLIQEQSKFGSRSFALFSLFQNSTPPFSKSWLRAWMRT